MLDHHRTTEQFTHQLVELTYTFKVQCKRYGNEFHFAAFEYILSGALAAITFNKDWSYII